MKGVIPNCLRSKLKTEDPPKTVPASLLPTTRPNDPLANKYLSGPSAIQKHLHHHAWQHRQTLAAATVESFHLSDSPSRDSHPATFFDPDSANYLIQAPSLGRYHRVTNRYATASFLNSCRRKSYPVRSPNYRPSTPRMLPTTRPLC